MRSEPASGKTDKPVLTETENGLVLTDGTLSIMADLTAMLPRVAHSAYQHEMLVKAAKIKHAEGPLTAVDATAGFGEDSLLLAAAGFTVTLCEYDPVIAALLRDALKRAAEVPELKELVSRMTLVEGDSISYLKTLETPPDLIYLDPMFPERRKSGLIKKKFQLLQQLESPCSDTDGEALFAAALAAGPRKIVIKRPAKGPYLGGRKPDYSYDGKAIRYDCVAVRT